jgi:hypothetical protein
MTVVPLIVAKHVRLSRLMEALSRLLVRPAKFEPWARGKVVSAVLVLAAAAIAFIYAQVEIATKSIQFDLRKIGESVYEARSKNGHWPAQIEDLDGTEYLKMPHRRTMLEQGLFVVVWQQNLEVNPEANRNRVLAYDNNSLLSRFGKVWVCRGDLRIERISADQIPTLKLRRQ